MTCLAIYVTYKVRQFLDLFHVRNRRDVWDAGDQFSLDFLTNIRVVENVEQGYGHGLRRGIGARHHQKDCIVLEPGEFFVTLRNLRVGQDRFVNYRVRINGIVLRRELDLRGVAPLIIFVLSDKGANSTLDIL